MPQTSIITAVNKNSTDLNHISLAAEFCIYEPLGSAKIKPADVDLAFANNTFSLVLHKEMFLKGKSISSSNNIYRRLAFNRTELTTDIRSKLTPDVFSGSRCRADEKTGQEVKEKSLAFSKKCDQFNLELYPAP